MKKPHIVIISPATAKANNGNWRTAQRWRRFLQSSYRVSISTDSNYPPADAMIALHARRSAEAVADFAASFPSRPLILALTGTDLYRDIHADTNAQRSLEHASHIVVLQDAGLEELPMPIRQKAVVIHQSANALKPAKPLDGKRFFRVTMIGHLRDEKAPLTFMRASQLAQAPRLRFVHIGSAIDPALEQAARNMQEQNPNYRWLGNLPHGKTRQLLKQSGLMVITSKMEGGANVIAEAVTSGVPVLASEISGNRGMLGPHYTGYFPMGDSRRLAALIDRAATDHDFYSLLKQQCDERAALFAPEREKATLLHLMDNALNANRTDL